MKLQILQTCTKRSASKAVIQILSSIKGQQSHPSTNSKVLLTTSILPPLLSQTSTPKWTLSTWPCLAALSRLIHQRSPRPRMLRSSRQLSKSKCKVVSTRLRALPPTQSNWLQPRAEPRPLPISKHQPMTHSYKSNEARHPLSKQRASPSNQVLSQVLNICQAQWVPIAMKEDLKLQNSRLWFPLSSVIHTQFQLAFQNSTISTKNSGSSKWKTSLSRQTTR